MIAGLQRLRAHGETRAWKAAGAAGTKIVDRNNHLSERNQ
jgi:hypothetical protein